MSKLYTPADAPTINKFGWKTQAPIPPDMTPTKYTIKTLKCPCSVSSGNAMRSCIKIFRNK